MASNLETRGKAVLMDDGFTVAANPSKADLCVAEEQPSQLGAKYAMKNWTSTNCSPITAPPTQEAAAKPKCSPPKKQLKNKQQLEACRCGENQHKATSTSSKGNGQKAPKTNSKSRVATDKVLDPKEYFESKVKFLVEQKAAGSNPYPHKFFVTTSIPEYLEKYGGLDNGGRLEDMQVSLAGRIMSKRQSSLKLLFYDLHGGGSKVQVVADARSSELEEAEFLKLHSLVKYGDIIGVTGFPAKSNRGELSIYSKSFVVLSHCLHMMPRQSLSALENANLQKGEPWAPGNIRKPDLYILNDEESRYRHRYLDLILNCEVRGIFKTRSKVISYIRKFLDSLDFLEVETPVMNTISSCPVTQFLTHHNDLNTKLYMRTTPDLYLRQLIIGGLERVYEIGKQFRNEVLDLRNNPEVTTCKFYMAFAGYSDVLELSEKMLSGMVKEITGGFVIKCHSNNIDKETVCIDFTPPFRRVDVMEELGKVSDLCIPRDLASEEAHKYLMDACAKYQVRCPPPLTTARLLDKLVDHFVKETCVNPTFIMNYPEIIRPHAKCHVSKPGITEFFELIVNKDEVCKACTEINDPMVLRQRLAEQLKDPRSCDNAAVVLDETCCTAVEYGLPPTASWGLAVDHLAMLLTDSHCIKEVLLFPTMKPEFKPPSTNDEYSFPSQDNHLSSISSSSFRIAIVGDIHEDWKQEHDSKALHFLLPDMVMFTGDFGNENVELVKGIANLNFRKAAILGNHDSWSTSKFSKKTKDGVQVQLESLGEAHVGYGHLEFPALNLSVVGGRPFSCGGNELFRKKLLAPRYGVRDMEESAKRIYEAALGTPEEHSIIFLAHNGPTGLGSNVDDICGVDWASEGGDHGDPDLAKAISQVKETSKYRIPLVVFGHMHKELASGGFRKMVAVDADNTVYLNAAIVPRVRYPSSGGSIHAFTVVEFSEGKLTKIAETWVSINDDKASLEEEFLLFSSN